MYWPLWKVRVRRKVRDIPFVRLSWLLGDTPLGRISFGHDLGLN